jgi:hypothetical protein
MPQRRTGHVEEGMPMQVDEVGFTFALVEPGSS